MTVFASTDSIVAVLDAGRRDGEPSTVVTVRGSQLHVLREGPIEL